MITLDSYHLYELQVPRIDFHQEKDMGTRTFELEVYSTSGNKTVDCIVQFREQSVAKNSVKALKRGGELPQFDLSSSPTKYFPMDDIYVGPNLRYFGKVANAPEVLVDFDVPQEIEMEFGNGYVETPGDWIFNRIVQSDSDPQFHYHQSGTNFSLAILECFPRLQGLLNEIECAFINSIDSFKGAITQFSEGVWHNQFLLGIVDSSSNKTVRFYTITGISSSQ